MEAKFCGAVVASLVREPAGDPGTEARGSLTSFVMGDMAMALAGSREPRRLAENGISPPKRLVLDRLWLAYENVRVNRPDLLAAGAGYKTFVSPAPSAKMSTGFVV